MFSSPLNVSHAVRARRAPALGCLAAFSFLALSLATPVSAQSSGGELGGGFIEFLMTGQSPARRQGAPAYAPPAPVSHPGAIALAPVSRVPRGGFEGHVPSGPMVGYAIPDEPDLAPAPAGRGPGGQAAPAPLASTFDPRFEKQEVAYAGPHRAGTIVIDTPNRYLYLVKGDGRALRYGIGVGRPGFEWAGVKSVTRKAEWPDWRPPAEMLKRRPDLPRHMAGGPDNPLGARALYLGSSLYRIHGTNEPETIGRAVSSGCIRMRNEDVVDLYGRVRVGAKVVVI